MSRLIRFFDGADMKGACISRSKNALILNTLFHQASVNQEQEQSRDFTCTCDLCQMHCEPHLKLNLSQDIVSGRANEYPNERWHYQSVDRLIRQIKQVIFSQTSEKSFSQNYELPIYGVGI